jgi:polar amino acid transport system substrate-binding protein
MKKIRVIILIFVLIFTACSGKREKITSLEQLSNKRICVLTGPAGDVTARKTFPNAKILDMIAAADAALSVKNNKADSFIHNKTILLNIIEKEPGLTLLEPPVSQVPIAAALNKNNTVLLEEINTAIRILKEDGTLEQMKKKWIDTEYKTAPSLPDIQMPDNGEILKLGTCSQSEPLVFLSDNKITGLDIELALQIGKKLNKKIEVLDMTFESLIPALQSGKIDFALGDFNVTEERKKYVNFSDEYLKDDISALVRK